MAASPSREDGVRRRSPYARLAGVHPEKGLFGFVPTWVDPSLPPGFSSNRSQVGMWPTASAILSMRYFLYSPNLAWFAIALAMHAIAPYDLDAAARGWELRWFLARFTINAVVAFTYYSYFFIGLYWAGWASREYRPGVRPTAGNMAHNLWYWSLGVLQWTCWEAVMMRLWATHVVPYASADEILVSPSLLARNTIALLVVPIWRDIHFYIAHRFIHIRAIYRFVHSLHHRNADPEPFSGLTMHPVEHLYYYSNAFIPSLYMGGLSPLVFLWCFIHLALAPACGHSGWEDHFQADQYHYLHHQRFECNYGSQSSGFIDLACGTFRERMGKSEVYRGAGSERQAHTVKDIHKSSSTVWARDSYLGLPSNWTHAVYTLFWMALWLLCWYGFVRNQGVARRDSIAGVPVEILTPLTLVYGPLVLALLLNVLSGDSFSWRWPFHKERLLGQFGFFVVLGQVAVLMPVYHAAKWASASIAQ